MKLLLDQDVYATTMRFLSNLDYDVMPVAQMGLSHANDEDLLRVAQEENRIFKLSMHRDETLSQNQKASLLKDT